jgi:hypothetical protein
VAALLVFLAAVAIPIWEFSPLQAATCESSTLNRYTSKICEDQYRPIRLADATVFLQLYVARLTAGGGPRESWDMTTPSYQQGNDYSALSTEMSNLFWTEMIGNARQTSTFNTFEFTYRQYWKGTGADLYDGHVQSLNEIVQLVDTQGETLINTTTDDERASPPMNVIYPRLTLVAAENVYQLPRLSSTVVEYVVTPTHDGDIHVGGQLTVLCDVDVDQSIAHPLEASADVGWWARTPQGWVPSRALSGSATAADANGGLGGQSQIQGVPQCDASVLTRT